MNLSKFAQADKSNEGVEMVLKDPATSADLKDEATGEPVTITLMGSDSSQYIALQRQISDARLRRASGMRSGLSKIIGSAEELEQDSIRLLTLATKGWKHVQLEEGKDLEFNPQNVTRIYTDFRWIREQAEQFIADRSNFLGNLSKI